MTENEKIKMVRKYFSMTMESFGERVGLKKSAISLMESGRSSVSNSLRTSVCREFGVSMDWLTGNIDGDEIVFAKTPGDVVSTFAQDNNLDPLEESLLREYLKLKDNERNVFRKYLKSVIANVSSAAEVDDHNDEENEEGTLLPFA